MMEPIEAIEAKEIHFERDDGGRAAAGFKGLADDCACRASTWSEGGPR